MTSEGQSACGQHQSPVSFTNLMVDQSDETIERRFSLVSGLATWTLRRDSAVDGLPLALRLTRRTCTSVERVPEPIGEFFGVFTASKEIFSNLREKPTGSYASRRFG